MNTEFTMDPDLLEELLDFRRQLHRFPELSMEEIATTRRIRGFLIAHGITPLDYGLPTGTVAVIAGKRPGPCIAVRADIDALPIEEETGLPYASEVPGKMHACGHDFHTVSVLGAALLTKQIAESDESFAGTVVFVFQPAEETGSGANLIADCGVFADYGVEAIIGSHNQPLLPSGTIGLHAGALMGSVDEFCIVIHGVGGHAAIPNAAVDPIVIASQVVSGLQHLVSRTVSPLDAVVVTIGQFHAGTANNIIPPEAELTGTIRCLQPHTRKPTEEHFRRFVTDTVHSYGGTVDIAFENVLPAVVNDAELTELMRASAVKVVGAEKVVEAEPTLAGEDFSLYQQRLPGCFMWVGTGKPDGTSPSWHHPAFVVDEAMLPVASRVFTQTALDYLSERSDIQ